MRIAPLVLLGSTVLGQTNNFPRSLDRPGLAEAVAPLEKWLGRGFVIFDDSVRSFPEAVFTPIFPETYEPNEARLTADAIYVSLAQIGRLQSASALADFLSHAAAHAKLDHPAKLQDRLAMLRILGQLPDVPAKYADAMEPIRPPFEAEAGPVKAEFRAAANCTPESCEMFERLLAVIKQ